MKTLPFTNNSNYLQNNTLQNTDLIGFKITSSHQFVITNKKRSNKSIVLTVLGALFFSMFINFGFAQKVKTYTLNSPDNQLSLTIQAGESLTWSASMNGETMIVPSTIAMQLKGGPKLGRNMNIVSTKNSSINETIEAQLYKKKQIQNNYNQLDIKCKDNWGIIFRAYNDGIAYRFYTSFNEEIIVANETAQFNITGDHLCFVPYVCDLRSGDKYSSAFESLYDEIKMSEFANDSLAILPLLIDAENGKKIAILEADLESYPGMFLTNNKTVAGFESKFAPYPLETQPGGFNMLNVMATKRADYIAKTKGTRSFPWRIAVFTKSDKELADNDMVYRLSTASKIDDTNWIKPGKVAWDWWNNWNISKVDFRAGINTETYKHYIDFAAKNNIEYIVLDEGWSATNDLLTISPKINLVQIIEHGKKNNVDVILWSTWQAMNKAMDEAMQKYSAMGVKGFKIDFLDRDDQLMVESVHLIAEKAAKYKMIVDYHGMYKPSGLNRTYPNVINFEGVRGLENCKWYKYDAPRYDVTAPFIRMIAGPMDYTPGGFRNLNRSNFSPVNDQPATMGTRCHQIAMYVVYEAPLQMLADNPTIYTKEQECTSFITKFPTVYDKTVALNGEVGEYITIAREKNNIWYVGALTNWSSRMLTLDFSFLEPGNYEAEIFSDGINADRDGTDYKREVKKIKAGDKLEISLSSGGGWAAQIRKL